MGKIGYGYGSEWHLMRYLARHRHELDGAICSATGGQMIDWLDYPFGDPSHFLLGEHKGLEFLFDGKESSLKQQWSSFWPQTGNPPNWDAVGWLKNASQTELLLVEAKCHEQELLSHCGAKAAGGLQLIRKSLDEVKQALGAVADTDWTKPYYQYCNRLAVLHFLSKNHVPARVLFIYFTGDCVPGQQCPGFEDEWESILQTMYNHIGVPWEVQQEHGVSKLFLPVSR